MKMNMVALDKQEYKSMLIYSHQSWGGDFHRPQSHGMRNELTTGKQ
jgi:hypothetical protein